MENFSNQANTEAATGANRVQQWLNLARWAPSGGNAQPWSVEFQELGEQVLIRLNINASYRESPSLMDVEGAASAMAIGSLATNLIILAGIDGYKLSETVFADESSIWKSSVLLKFTKGREAQAQISADEILLRRTDRGRLKQDPISTQLRDSVHLILQKYPSVTFAEVAGDKSILVKELSKLEKVRWINLNFLSSTISEIDFSTKTEGGTSGACDKIPAGQLGVAYPDRIFLKIINRFQTFGVWLMRMGFYRIPVYKNISSLVFHCDRVVLMQAKALDFKSCVEFGQCFQELWLEINAKQISFQPVASGLLALAFWRGKDNYDFSNEQERILREATDNFQRLYNVDLRQPTVGFRIGVPTKAAGKSPRKELTGVPASLACNTQNMTG